MNGANRALVGTEIIQFANAASLGAGLWQLTGLLRGRGGTEFAVGNHAADEDFVLLDGTASVLDGATVGSDPSVTIAALGLGDAAPVDSTIINRGITLAPLAPVHAAAIPDGNGGLTLQWTRRARGAWVWSDLVDAPLVEESENYQVGYGPPSMPLGLWSCTSPSFTVDASTFSGLRASLSDGAFFVRQMGTYAASPACTISA